MQITRDLNDEHLIMSMISRYGTILSSLLILRLIKEASWIYFNKSVTSMRTVFATSSQNTWSNQNFYLALGHRPVFEARLA